MGKEDSAALNRLKEQASLLPDLPGVYQYYNSEGKIIYVGKAKNLKKRVSSYFHKTPDRPKTAILVKNIADIKHVVVDTEEDALLLENNLIKKYQPRYNVLLKDDKSYPWICIKNEPFPRVFMTRQVVRDGSQYFGPYTSIQMVRTIIEVIKQLFPLRNCALNLSRISIERNVFKHCLEYQIGNCKAPCENLQSEKDYLENISQIREILKGNLATVLAYLKGVMQQLSIDYKFEEAAVFKNKISFLENYRSKSTIVSSSITNIDVFSFDQDENYGYINFLRVVDGAIVQTHTLEIKKRLDESKEELMALGIIEIRLKFFLNAKEIIIPFPINIHLKEIKWIIPQIGEKRKLLELSERNVKFYKLDKHKQLSLKSPQSRTTRLLEKMQSDLRLTELPHRIECFDNSNIQGNQPVAACVVFFDGRPAKREYRHFNIKTVEGPNDFASMEEIIYRRYSRILEEEKDLPQLIVVDGGKGQLSATMKSIDALNLRGRVAVIGIAKRLEEIIYPDDLIPLYLDKNSETLRIIQQLRDEAHRFGITFHRNKRSKEFIVNELEQIPGIGEKTVELLIRKFKSVKRLKNTPAQAIIDAIGLSKAEKIQLYFNQSEIK